MHLSLLAAIGLVGLTLGSLVYKIIYENFITPLRHIPGPWYAPYTQIPAFIAGPVKRCKTQYCHDLHHRYGPFVRVGPNEVLVADTDALKEIHRMGTPFHKTEMYTFLNAGSPGQRPYGLFQETEPKIHQARRKLFANGFSARALRQAWSDLVRDKAAAAIERLDESAKAHPQGEVDVLRWWASMAADVISTVSFGQSFGMVETGVRATFLEEASLSAPYNMLQYQMPWVYGIISRLPIDRVQNALASRGRLRRLGEEAVADSYKNAQHENIFRRILTEADNKDAHISQAEMVTHAASFIFAGTDTTSNTLTYLVWAVLSHPELQAALSKEVAQLEEPLLDEQLEQLPILSATIKESLRLYGAAPNGLPRHTPPGGAQFGDYFVPGGTIVTTQAWTYHRDPNFYPDPEKFDYARWLSPSSPANSAAAQASFFPFGIGSRICIGKHLAEMEMRMATAMFFRRFKEAKLAPSTTPESMAIRNIFLIEPDAGECRVRL